MQTLRLEYPVTLPDGIELLPAGAVLSETTMSDLIAGAGSTDAMVRLFDYGTVNRDVRRFCAEPPYGQIFSGSGRMAALLDQMQQVALAEPLMAFLDYFKQNDDYTYRHILIVFALSILLAQDLIADPEVLAREAVAAPTHDFGKICVPIEVLKKETRLTLEERVQLGHHAAAGYVLLSYYFRDCESPAAVTARDHHERCDGSGYPAGIALDNPMVEIVAVCDVFDALIARRPYRPTSYDVRTALEEITEMATRGRFHWDVVQALVGYNRKSQPHFSELTVSRERRGTPPVDNVYSGTAKSPTRDR